MAVIFFMMRDHVQEHVADMPIGYPIDDLLGMALANHQPGAPQQPQMVADQRLGQLKRLGNLGDGRRTAHAVKQNPEVAGITQKPKGFRQPGQFFS